MTDNDMIRDKAIFIKLNQLHFSDQQLFDMAVSRFDLSRCTCPTCGSIGQFRIFYSYERSLITISEGKREEKSISVSRFLCESCNHTHALLPDILIPYGSYSLRFILTILLAYLKRTDTVAAFCEHWHISVSTLYAWIHLFVEQYNAVFRQGAFVGPAAETVFHMIPKCTTSIHWFMLFPAVLFNYISSDEGGNHHVSKR